MSVYDVAIVGAGPAGSAAGITLAAEGAKVLIVDKKEFPREKVCGDGLIADSIQTLRKLGVLGSVLARGRRIDQATWYSPSRHQIRIGGEFITIKRLDLDEILLSQACAKGAQFESRLIEEVREDGDCLSIGHGIGARVVMLATGADTRLAAGLGLAGKSRADALAIRGYVRSDAEIEEMVFSSDKETLPGYAWIFPLPNQEFNIGFGAFGQSASSGVNLKHLLDKFLRSFPVAQQLMASGEFLGPPKGARLRCGLSSSSPIGFDGRLMLLGENIGTTFQFSGEGIGKAMESGILAAELAACFVQSGDEGFLLQYPQVLDQYLRPKYRGYAVAEKYLTIPWVGDLLAKRAARSKFIMEGLTGIVNETRDPAEVFSLKGLIRSFVS